jgi:hypothetical protein
MTALNWKQVPRGDGWSSWRSEIFRTDAIGWVLVNSAVAGKGEFEELLGYDVAAVINGHHYETKLASWNRGNQARLLAGEWVDKLIEQQQTDLAEANRAAALLSGRKAP